MMTSNPRFLDLTGQIFSRLTVLRYSHVRRATCGALKHYWVCKCECGIKKIVEGVSLRSGKTKSCNCFRFSGIHRTHGLSNTAQYAVWAAMLARCRNKRNRQYPDYGGRGILVCDRWLTYANFICDMGERPSDHTIERLDNNKGYCPENCQWVTQRDQNNNRRDNVQVDFRGETKTLAQWASDLGLNYFTLYNRLITLRWPTDRAFLQPVRLRS